MTDEPEKVTPDTSDPITEETETVSAEETTSIGTKPDDKPETQPAPLVAKAGKGSSRRPSKKFIAILLLVIAAGSGAVWWSVQDKGTKVTPAVTQSTPKQKQEEAPTDPLLAKFIKPTTGEVWLPAPKKIESIGALKDESAASEITYYEVGSRGSATIVLLTSPGGLFEELSLLEKSADGSIAYIALPDGTQLLNEENQRYATERFKATVKIDTTTHYDSLTMPTKLLLDDKYSVSKPSYVYVGERGASSQAATFKYTDIKTYGLSKIQRIESSYADTKLTSIQYRLITPMDTFIRLDFEPLDLSLKNYQWQRGHGSSDTLKSIARGCGALGTSVTRSDAVTDAELQQVGRSPAGLDVYEFKDSNATLVNKAYEEFKTFVAGQTEVPYYNITKEDFIKQHGIVLYKDKYGQWLVYARQELSPAYGCAKPVVYLYPQTPTLVGVKVGADVKISEPHYNPRTGWKALALPNGKLLTTAGIYDSLFWEGPGIGEYPSITEGTIVPRAQALATIQVQLKQLGLNSKEIADFVEYWQPKLPSQPYVRLTWLTTEQMNQLAPLHITPKPDTVIRVFLDFSGLDQPIWLPAQQLTAIPRAGFTVVEWGGLSPTKLY